MMASMGGGGMDIASMMGGMGGGMDMASMGDGEEDEVDDALGRQDDTLDGQDEGSLHNDDCQDEECEECSA